MNYPSSPLDVGWPEGFDPQNVTQNGQTWSKTSVWYTAGSDWQFRVQSSGLEQVMAKHCEICGKTPVVGRILSHAHNVRARRFEPNLQRIRAKVGGGVRRIRVCTRCIRSNRVVKAA